MLRKRTYTVREAAELTGLTPKAISRRIERGSLRSVLKRGRRLIPDSELVRAGLIPTEGEREGRWSTTPPLLSPRLSPSETPNESMLASLFAELLDRLERQANDIAQFRALTAQAESLRLEGELAELRARMGALEAGSSPAGATPVAQAETTRVTQRRPDRASALERLWLPPAAAAPVSPRRTRAASPPGPVPDRAADALGPARSFTWSIPALLLEAGFIAAVAVITALAELPAPLVVASVGIAWLIAATSEGLRWRRRSRS